MDIDKLQKIVQPCGDFKVFFPKIDDPKLKEFVNHLMKRDRYISDELRDYDSIWAMVFQMLYGGQSILFELGDFQGLIGFLDIMDGWRCRVMFKIWDKKFWTHNHIKQGKELLDRFMNTFNLVRMESHTADPIMLRLGEKFGFTEEGRMKKNFKWDGKLYDLILMSRIRQEV